MQRLTFNTLFFAETCPTDSGEAQVVTTPKSYDKSLEGLSGSFGTINSGTVQGTLVAGHIGGNQDTRGGGSTRASRDLNG